MRAEKRIYALVVKQASMNYKATPCRPELGTWRADLFFAQRRRHTLRKAFPTPLSTAHWLFVFQVPSVKPASSPHGRRPQPRKNLNISGSLTKSPIRADLYGGLHWMYDHPGHAERIERSTGNLKKYLEQYYAPVFTKKLLLLGIYSGT